MDVSSILFAAGTVLGTKAIEESTKLAVTELWSALKAMVTHSHGSGSAATVVLDEVERLPADTPASPALVTRIDALKLNDSPATQALLQQLELMLRQRAPAVIEKQYNFHGGTFHNTTFN